jgi:protein-ribulosamine 3-kinase
MAPAVDPAILEALGLDASQASISAHGGSGFSSTFKLSAVVDGKPVDYFVKSGSGSDAEVMFRGTISKLRPCRPQDTRQRC